ncbi:MAG: phosphoribosylformylglycinamidine synthase subunit PurQ [Myxococcota bacterium]
MKRVAVVTFPGSNCDADLRHAVDLHGMKAVAVWHKDTSLGDVDAVLLPGGFSYGDYLRCGAIARFSPIMGEVIRFAERGGPVLGICNGFQILTECGLVPGVLLRNAGLKFLCRDVSLSVEGRETPFTKGVAGPLRLPIAHMEGNWFADPETHARVEGEGQVIFRYRGGAPNGALGDVAGVCNTRGNVLGLMPHPERYVEEAVGGHDGAGLFRALAEVLG